MDDTTPSKTCTRCGAVKVLDDFPVRSKSRDGRAPRCRDCASDTARRWREKNADKVKATAAAYRAQERESLREKSRLYYAANRDQRSAANRAHYEATRDVRRISQHAWYEANRESIYKRSRQWFRDNPDLAANYRARRRARVLGTTVGPIDLASLWTGFCGICGDELDGLLRFPDPLSKSVDHILPLAKGGGHIQENLQWSHLICNQSKSDRLTN